MIEGIKRHIHLEWNQVPKELGLHVLLPTLAGLSMYYGVKLDRTWSVIGAFGTLGLSFLIEPSSKEDSKPYAIVKSPGDGHCMFHSVAKMTKQNVDASELLARLANYVKTLVDELRKISGQELKEVRGQLPANRQAQLIADVIIRSHSRGDLNQARPHLNLEQQVNLMFEREPVLAYACAKRIIADGDQVFTDEANTLLEKQAFLCAIRTHLQLMPLRPAGQAPQELHDELKRSVVWRQISNTVPRQEDYEKAGALYVRALEVAATGVEKLWGAEFERNLLSHILEATIIVYESDGSGVKERNRIVHPNAKEVITVYYTGNHYNGITFEDGGHGPADLSA